MEKAKKNVTQRGRPSGITKRKSVIDRRNPLITTLLSSQVQPLPFSVQAKRIVLIRITKKPTTMTIEVIEPIFLIFAPNGVEVLWALQSRHFSQ